MRILILLLALLFTFPAYALSGSITLQWDQQDPAPEGYKVYQRILPAEFNFDNPITAQATTDYMINDLTPGSTYGFIVQAFNGDIQGANSNEIIYTQEHPQSQVVHPRTPININYNDGVISWQHADIDQIPSDGYIVHAIGTDHLFDQTYPTDQLTWDTNTLEKEKQYEVVIYAVSGDLKSDQSTKIIFTPEVVKETIIIPRAVKLIITIEN